MTKQISILCEACREPFIAERRSARFCNATCRNRHHRNPAAYRRKVAHVALSALSVTLRVVPLTLAEANAAATQWHRHHRRAVGPRFSIGVMHGDELVGAAIVSRPVARQYDARAVAEVNRLATDGTPHVCSMLNAATNTCAAGAQTDGHWAGHHCGRKRCPGYFCRAALATSCSPHNRRQFERPSYP
jgi:hypothetical protein